MQFDESSHPWIRSKCKIQIKTAVLRHVRDIMVFIRIRYFYSICECDIIVASWTDKFNRIFATVFNDRKISAKVSSSYAKYFFGAVLADHNIRRTDDRDSFSDHIADNSSKVVHPQVYRQPYTAVLEQIVVVIKSTKWLLCYFLFYFILFYNTGRTL